MRTSTAGQTGSNERRGQSLFLSPRSPERRSGVGGGRLCRPERTPGTTWWPQPPVHWRSGNCLNLLLTFIDRNLAFGHVELQGERPHGWPRAHVKPGDDWGQNRPAVRTQPLSRLHPTLHARPTRLSLQICLVLQALALRRGNCGECLLLLGRLSGWNPYS